ncbi:MAG: DEAD/DEAH box helicase [Deltaproteobacteria bacterium]|nr:DEAD/DEAH box helicase [Deltaproteobacteria bacterium]
MLFSELKLDPKLLAAVGQEGYTTPTPIQARAIPEVLAGRDLMGCAQTGTGKTAAFALPILQHLMTRAVTGPRRIRALVLVPTRELAAQVNDSFSAYGRHSGLRSAVVVGGVSQGPQVTALRAGVDIVVAAPGRLLDLMQQGHVRLDAVEILVLDEADRMLDMGFIQPIRRIVSTLPKVRQNLMFSATMPNDIRALADTILKTPAFVAVDRVAAPAAKVEQKVYYVERQKKLGLLLRVLERPDAFRVLVFSRTKHGADKLARKLRVARVDAEVLHGNKSQGARTRALDNFKRGRARVLVATDVAARGLDVDDVSHVINFDIPNEPESYVHRIGRTGRAGATGLALSFCDHDERGFLRDIERLTRMPLAVAG